MTSQGSIATIWMWLPTVAKTRPPPDLELRKVEPAERSPASDGRTSQQIADELVITPGTVKSHVKRVLRKLHACNRAEAASIFARLGNAPNTV